METTQDTPARDPFRYLMKLARERPVARYRAGAEQAYLVSDPDVIIHVNGPSPPFTLSDPAYGESTTPSGRSVVMFSKSEGGTDPPVD